MDFLSKNASQSMMEGYSQQTLQLIDGNYQQTAIKHSMFDSHLAQFLSDLQQRLGESLHSTTMSNKSG